jgi:hypothetical protein
VENNQEMYTEEQLMARLKFFIGVCLAVTLTGIVFVVLYSIIFVTQPLNAISPIDQKFFELIIPIATFLTGTLSGIMLSGGTKEEQANKLAAMKMSQENAMAAKTPMPPATPVPSTSFAPAASWGTTPTTQQTSQVIVGFGGKPAPVPAPQPEL